MSESAAIITEVSQASPFDLSVITDILDETSAGHAPGWQPEPLCLLLKSSTGETMGGLTGTTNWGWLRVDLLAVDKKLRGARYGSQLLSMAEDIARERGCTNSFLNTFSFQARGFYERHGYRVFGMLDNFPTGATRFFMKKTLAFLFCLLLSAPAFASDATGGGIKWHSFDEALFARARKEKKFVLLDLEAVWCHWCHVMDKETYSNADVIKLLKQKYICVRVDQDARPDLSTRYEEYGWPATIIFNGDGGEIVKRSGFINPGRMAKLLAAIIKDPSPEDATSLTAMKTQAAASAESNAGGGSLKLSDSLKAALNEKHNSGYDSKYGAWGTYQKFIDFDSAEYAMVKGLGGDKEAERRAKASLDGELNLIDPEFGGVYQYSTHGDWQHPHFEKIMQTQAENMRLYALAYRFYKDEKYLNAARSIAAYLQNYLMSPDGAFYTSQDADLVAGEHSGEYFTLKAAERLKLGLPRIDKSVYSRENGWAITAMVELYLASRDAKYLDQAVKAERYIAAHRALPGGGFAHGESDSAGPYLSDNLAMARAYLALYGATGERSWLVQARKTFDFIDANFQSAESGYLSAPAAGRIIAAPAVLLDENVMLARQANLLFNYSGAEKYRKMAERAMSYLSKAETSARRKTFVAGILLADLELQAVPLHISVVGSKSDRQAADLFLEAAALPASCMRVEWFDAKEGPLPNTDVELPQLPKAAAFICGNGRCSAPAYDVESLQKLFARINASSK